MKAAENTARVDRCPDPSALAEYGVGRLSRDLLEAIAAHLARCARCRESLGTLADGEDALLARLRGRPLSSPFWEEPECALLEAAARALHTSSVSTVVEPPPDRADDATPEGAPAFPRAFGPYDLLAKLGRGGMGTVYRALQGSLNRVVAVKVLSAGAHAGADQRARFRREGEAIARLRHANIVQVYDCGEHEEQPYFSMELAEGGSLARRLSGSPLPPRQAAELVQTLAQAVQHAHDSGILHRDLKPSNVLLTDDGTPKISDFGLAKLLDAEQGQTQSDLILGTPSYMAPEQAWGSVREIGPRADVYALGAILYECLTGRPPFRAETSLRTLEQVRSADPELPSRILPDVPRELEAICLKCLEKRRGDRYPSADALADDLGRWLGGTAVLARPRAWPARTWRRVSRRPVLAALACLVVLAAALTPALVWYADPERPLRGIEADLARGRTVTLVGKTGLPRWFRARGGACRVALSADGVLSVDSYTVSLVELLPDPGRERYSLRARVRHDKSLNIGGVGIYCGHRQYGTGPEAVHQFVQLSYNDIRSSEEFRQEILQAAKAGATRAEPKGLAPNPFNPVRLYPHLFSEGGSRARLDHPGDGVKESILRPAGLAGGPWHELRLDVTHRRVRAYWEGKLLAELGADALHDATAGLLPSVWSLRPGDPLAGQVDPAFTGRGGLGLYVENGVARFQSVTIEPFDGGD